MSKIVVGSAKAPLTMPYHEPNFLMALETSVLLGYRSANAIRNPIRRRRCALPRASCGTRK